jgi:hypothetical protein
LTAVDCKVLGVVDTIVPEPEGGAHLDPGYAALLLRNFVLDALIEMRKRSAKRLVDDRYRKFRRMGQQPAASRRDSFARDTADLQTRFGSAIGQVLELLSIRDGGSRESPDAVDSEPPEPDEAPS